MRTPFFRSLVSVVCTGALGLTLSSCASKYAQRSWGLFSGSTGYDEVPVDENTYRVMFDGNAWTNAELVDRYALYRAAELTNQRGYDYFVIIDDRPTSNTTITTGAPVNHTDLTPDIDPLTGHVVTVATTTTTQSVSSTTTHSAVKTFRMFKGKRPENSTTTYDAKSMINVMGPYITR